MNPCARGTSEACRRSRGGRAVTGTRKKWAVPRIPSFAGFHHDDFAHPRAPPLTSRNRACFLIDVVNRRFRFVRCDFVGASWRTKTGVQGDFGGGRFGVWGVRREFFFRTRSDLPLSPFVVKSRRFFCAMHSSWSDTPFCQTECELHESPVRGRGFTAPLQRRPSRFSPSTANLAVPSDRNGNRVKWRP